MNIEDLARQAGAMRVSKDFWSFPDFGLARFAAIVLEQAALEAESGVDSGALGSIERYRAHFIADAIRALSLPPKGKV